MNWWIPLIFALFPLDSNFQKYQPMFPVFQRYHVSTGHHSQIRFNIYIDPLNKLFKMTAYFIALSIQEPLVSYSQKKRWHS